MAKEEDQETHPRLLHLWSYDQYGSVVKKMVTYLVKTSNIPCVLSDGEKEISCDFSLYMWNVMQIFCSTSTNHWPTNLHISWVPWGMMQFSLISFFSAVYERRFFFFGGFFLSYRFATYQLCISNFQPVDFFSTLKALKLQCTCIPFHMYLCRMNEKMALNIIQVLLLLLLSNCAN